MRLRRPHAWFAFLAAAVLVCSACTTTGIPLGGETPTGTGGTGSQDQCPGILAQVASCMTPHALRVAYGVQPLTDKGDTGKGQTVMVVVSYTSSTLQQDLDTFSDQFGLPRTQLQFYKLQPNPDNPNNPDVAAWGEENTLDVEMIHAIAPDAKIVVLVSQVDETEGTIGVPQFLQVESYAAQHHLGTIFSQSWAASEATLADSAGQQAVQQFDAFYKQIASQGFTVVSATGDNGVTDCANINCILPGGIGVNPQDLATTPTINFPADDPWVTAVGGTTLTQAGGVYSETAWSGSGGGVSKFFAQPDYQKGLPSSAQSQLGGQRGIPDVAADADPNTALAIYVHGQWQPIGGTSASTPLWAGVLAVANQVAGHPLGFINPALYKVGLSSAGQQAFDDVTSGDNTNDQAPNGGVQGFDAVAGWDPVTGWGGPHADQLIPALIAAQGSGS